jgi:hypothetical protein
MSASSIPSPASRWTAGLALIGVCLLPATAWSFADELDRMWQNHNPVPQGQCRMFIVKAWPDKIYRGRVSPHDCLVHAVSSYRAGDHEEAFGWIQASVCPDRELQQSMVRQAPAVIEHLLTRYAPHVP